MPLTPISMGARSNPGRNSAISVARLVNCYAEDAGEEGKIKLPIVAADGFSSFATPSGTGVAGIRALLPFSATVAYGVSGTKIFKVTSGGTVTLLSPTLSGSGLVTLCRNRRASNPQVAVVCGGVYYLINTTNDTVTTPTTSTLSTGTLVSVCVNDGYFLLCFDNGEFSTSGIDDGATLDPLLVASAESNADSLVRGFARSGDVVLAGERSTEFWNDTGAADFAYERTATADFGCYAAASMVSVPTPQGENSDGVMLAATDAQGGYYGVCLLSAYTASKVSSLAVDRAVRAGASTIVGFSWSAGGHIFYAISDQSTYTWVYDLTTGLWHERTSSGLNFWRISCAMSFGGNIILGDYTSAKLYSLSPSLYASGTDCVLTVKHSNDNGSTWVATRTATISQSTDLKQRYKFSRLGQSKEDGKVFQVSISNAVMEDGTGNSMIVQPPAVHAWPKPMRFYMLHVDAAPGVSRNATAKAITGLAIDAEAVRP